MRVKDKGIKTSVRERTALLNPNLSHFHLLHIPPLRSATLSPHTGDTHEALWVSVCACVGGRVWIYHLVREIFDVGVLVVQRR